MRTSGIWLGILTTILLQVGCSFLPERPAWTKLPLPSLGLPSPQATISASEKDQAAKAPPNQAPQNSAASAEISRGKALEVAGKLDKARKVYEDALRQNPNNAEAAHALGIVADKQGRHTDAEQCFLFALEKQPRNPELLSDLGYCFFLQGRLDNAEAALVKATTIEPTNTRYRNNLGLVLGHQKRYEDAFAQFTQTGNEADAFYNMAFVFAAQDLPDEAKGCFQQALTIDPNYQPAREALASFEAFDRLPPGEQKTEPGLAKGGVRYVPYLEGSIPDAQPGSGEVRQASATAPVAPMPSNRDAGRSIRNLQLQSRGLLGGHMQSQRNAQSAANAAALGSQR